MDTKNLLFLILTLLLNINILNGQCDDRYGEEIFSDVTIETVTYSDVTGFLMDIYEPEGDSYTNRPLIILAHGGAFAGGSKNNPTMRDLCTTFAKRGYVTASLNYTLAENLVVLSDSIAMIDIVMSAVADGKSAIRFFRKSVEESGNPYGIDTDQIWVGGNSAGAILMNHLAYIKEDDEVPTHIQDAIDANGGLQGDAGNDGFSSEISGVINLAGGLNDASWLSEDDEPIISCHGDMDGTVPFDCNDVFWADPILGNVDLIDICGSEVLHARTNEIGVDNRLHVFEGADHTPWSVGDQDALADIISFVQAFVQERIDCNIISSTNDAFEHSTKVYPNPASDIIFIQSDNQARINTINIYDITGQLVNQNKVDQTQVEVPIHYLNTGIYTIEIVTNKGPQFHKIVIN